MLRERAEAVVTGEAAAEARLETAWLEVGLVMEDEDLLGRELEEARRRAHRTARLVHVGLRLQKRGLPPVEPDLREVAGELRPERAAVPTRELVADHEADVVARPRVLAPGISQAGYQQVEGRGLLAPTKPPHRLLALGRLLFAAGFRLRLARRLGPFRKLALGQLDLRRRRHRREHGLGIVEERHALRGAQIAHAQAVSDSHTRDVQLEP